MSVTLLPATLTLKDIAREAGVSVATVDRVLHVRPGVRPDTVRRVKATIERHQQKSDSQVGASGAARANRFAFVMSTGSNLFMQQITSHVADMGDWLSSRRTTVEIIETDVLNPDVLAETLESLIGRFDGVAVVALDHPSVRAAIDDLVESGTHVVTLVSDVPSSRRQHYVGVENIAAGRTAGTLIGRLVGARVGKIGVIAGSQSLRDHIERIFGFNQVLSSEFPTLEVLAPIEGRDEDDLSETLAMRLLNDHPDLIAIYNVGAGTPGVAKAIAEARRDPRLVFVGHDLTVFTRRYLLRGQMDAVISQDAGHEARSAIRILLALASQEPILIEQEKIRIDIVMRDNLP